MTIGFVLLAVVLLAPTPASATLGAAVPARDGWALSADTAVNVDGVVCGWRSKIVVGPSSLAMQAGIADLDVPVVDVIVRGLAFDSLPTVDDVRAIHTNALRAMAGESESTRRKFRHFADPRGRLSVIRVLTVHGDRLRSVTFTVRIGENLEPIVGDRELWVAWHDAETPLTVDVAGGRTVYEKLVHRPASEPLIPGLRGRLVGKIDVATAAHLSRQTIERTIAHTYTLPLREGGGYIGGPVETVTLTAAGARWLHRLPSSLRNPRISQESCRALYRAEKAA